MVGFDAHAFFSLALDAEFQRSARKTDTRLKYFRVNDLQSLLRVVSSLLYCHCRSLGIDTREQGRKRFETGRAPVSGRGRRTDQLDAAHTKLLDQSHSQRRTEQSRIFSLSSSDVDLPPVESLAFLEQTKQTFTRLENEAAVSIRSVVLVVVE